MALGPGTSALTPTIASPPRVPARTATVRAQFDARAARYAQHAVLPTEVGRRLVERLDPIRLVPRRILDVGCGGGAQSAALAERYPDAWIAGLDLSEGMLRSRAATLRGRLPRWLGGRRPPLAVADAGQLPVADGAADLLLSNLMLHWHPQPHLVFPEWKRVLRTDGLLLFSCFGPDTLKELRAACSAALPHARPMPFIDMHDFGDMLVASGYANPVMDAEILTLTFASAGSLLREVRALGGNPRDDRAGGLAGSAAARRLMAALDAGRLDDGRLQLTFEVAYGHAWKPAGRDEGSAISLDSLRANLAARRRTGP